MSTILLCEIPDSRLNDLQSALGRRGYKVVAIRDRSVVAGLHDGSALDQIDLEAIDLVILDLSAGRGGEAVCQAFGDYCLSMPIVLLISETMPAVPEYERLTCGNVLRMPFTPRKVLNRVRKLLESREGAVLEVGDLTLNLGTRCVYKGRMFHRLTPRQAKLLEVFMQHTGQTLTRRFLMETVWDTDYMGDTRTLDVHVRWIRERIEEHPSAPTYLRTVRGIGYRFGVPDEPAGSESDD